MKQVKKEIKELHSHHYSQAHKKVEEFREHLNVVQQDPNISERLKEKEIINKLRYWSHVEESILYQKSRINWLSLGDSNTKFFFTVVKIRKYKNNINLLQNN